MTTFCAVTTYAPCHWEVYAKRCVDTFSRYWNGVSLYSLADGDLLEKSEWLRGFKKENAHRPTSNYRLDAVRFAHKVAAIEWAYREMQEEVLVWIDADCVTLKMVDTAWLSSLIGSAEFALLLRERKYPECGFMMMRRGAGCDLLVRQVVEMYRDGSIFRLPEWHDSFVIDYVRRRLCDAGVLQCVSLSGNAAGTGHPLVNGPLGERIDHLKGKRKTLDRSPEMTRRMG